MDSAPPESERSPRKTAVKVLKGAARIGVKAAILTSPVVLPGLADSVSHVRAEANTNPIINAIATATPIFGQRTPEPSPTAAPDRPKPIERPELAPPDAKSKLYLYVFKKFTAPKITATNQRILNQDFLKSEDLRIKDKNGNFREDFKATAKYIDQNYSPLIDQAIETIEARTKYKNIDPAWRDILKGIIYLESKGHPHPQSDDIPGKTDRGLTQVKPEAKAQALKILGWGDVDLWNPGNNITVALAYLMWLNEVFEDPSLAIEAYNDGPGNLITVLRAKTGSQADAAVMVRNGRINIIDLPDVNKRQYAFGVLASSFNQLTVTQKRN